MLFRLQTVWGVGGADLLQFAAPENAEITDGWKNQDSFKEYAKTDSEKTVG